MKTLQHQKGGEKNDCGDRCHVAEGYAERRWGIVREDTTDRALRSTRPSCGRSAPRDHPD